jgi:hypothetical protein
MKPLSVAVLTATVATAAGLPASPPSTSDSRRLMTWSCASPTGVTAGRWSADADVTSGADGYSGVTPQFVYDTSRPAELLVLWGSSRLGLDPKQTPRDSAQSATVVGVTEDHVIAAGFDGTDYWVYALYLREGLGYFTRNAPGNAIVPARASVFWSACETSVR